MIQFELRLGPLLLSFTIADKDNTTEPEREYVPAALVERADLTDPPEPVDRVGFRA